MKEQTVRQVTGRSKSEWFDIIRKAQKAEASHKEIADFLHRVHGVSLWWAQEITVEYEKHSGRRVLGQTQDGLFQIGVSKTVLLPSAAVWDLLRSTAGISLITSIPETEPPPGRTEALPAELQALEALDGESAGGIRVATTTFEEGTHVRLRWQRRGWSSHSILQIRVTPKGEAKTTLSFHQEKLPSRDDRDTMGKHWRRVAALLAGMAAPAGSADG